MTAAILKLFSLYYDLYHVEQLKEVSLRQVARMMKGETLKKQTEKIRSATNPQVKSKLKSQLPIITACGTFNPRKTANLVKPSFCYQLDIDVCENPATLLEKLTADELLTVLIASISVSGRGLKALLLMLPLSMDKAGELTADQYRDLVRGFHYNMADYFAVYYSVEIDGQMKNPCQPFFLFHSPDLWVNPLYI